MSEYPLLASNAITLRQFEYFVAAVQLGSLSAAARSFGITPSALSQQVDALETALGRNVFEPGSRRSKLTTFGSAFFGQASNVVESAGRAIAMGQMSGDGIITVGTTPTIAQKLLPPLIYRMRREQNIDCVEVKTFTDLRELNATLEKGALDLAVGPMEHSSSRVVRCFGEEELVVVCHPSQHRDFDGSWQQLVDAPWIHCGANSYLTGIISREAGRVGRHIRFTVRAPDVTTALSMVEYGVGVALVPKMALHGTAARLLSIIRLSRPIRRALTVHARDQSPHVEKFLEVIGDSELVEKFRAAGLLVVERSHNSAAQQGPPLLFGSMPA